MFIIEVNLGSSIERIPYYSKNNAIKACKEIGKCVDVEESYVTDAQTGEVFIHFQNQQLVWATGYGEF